MELQKYQRAASDFSTAIKLDPQTLRFLCARADCYTAMGQFDDALRDATEIQRRDLSNPKALFDKAQLQYVTNSLEQCVESLNRVQILIDAQDSNQQGDAAAAAELQQLSLLLRGICKWKLSCLEDALADFDQIMSLPTLSLAVSQECRASCCQVLITLRRYNEAFKCISEVASACARHFQCLYLRGMCELHLESVDSAVLSLSSAVDNFQSCPPWLPLLSTRPASAASHSRSETPTPGSQSLLFEREPLVLTTVLLQKSIALICQASREMRIPRVSTPTIAPPTLVNSKSSSDEPASPVAISDAESEKPESEKVEFHVVVNEPVDRMQPVLDDIARCLEDVNLGAKPTNSTKPTDEDVKRQSSVLFWLARAQELSITQSQAISTFKRALDLNPSHRETLTYLAKTCLFRLSSRVDAIERLDRIRPKDHESYCLLGSIQTADEHYEDALNSLNAGLRLVNTFPPLLFQRGVLYTRMRSNNSALNDFSRCIELISNWNASQVLKDLVYSSALYFQSLLLIANGSTADALKGLGSCLTLVAGLEEIEDFSKTPSDDLLPYFSLEDGSSRVNLAHVCYLMSSAYILQNDSKSALSCLEQALNHLFKQPSLLQHESLKSQILYRLGIACAAMLKWTEGVRYLRQARDLLKAEKGLNLVYEGNLGYVLGVCLVHCNDSGSAIEAFEYSLGYSEEDQDLRDLARHELSKLLFCRGDYEGSLSHLSAVVRSQPKNAQALVVRAGCNLMLGNRSAAASDFVEARLVSGGDPHFSVDLQAINKETLLNFVGESLAGSEFRNPIAC